MAKRKPKVLKTMGAPENIESLLALFSTIPDPRIDRTKAYPLVDFLFLILAATVSGVNHLTQVQEFGKVNLDWLRTISPYENGAPSHDTIGRVMGLLDPGALEAMFVRWMESAARIDGVIAVDSKTLRGAIKQGAERSSVHIVSAFSAKNGLVYGQVKAEEKSNEITAIPRLLDLLRFEGAIVTIDAAGCQVKITDKIIERGGDFLIAVKGNQGTLQEDLSIAFHDVDIRGGQSSASVTETEELSYGRGEWRKCEIISTAGIINHEEKWKHVRSEVRVTTERRLDKTTTPETHTRHYISSMSEPEATDALQWTREHWGVENRLHWQLDVTFREDHCRVYAGHAAENFVVIRHIALNLLRAVVGLPKSLATRRSQAAWSDSAREKILQAGLQ